MLEVEPTGQHGGMGTKQQRSIHQVAALSNCHRLRLRAYLFTVGYLIVRFYFVPVMGAKYCNESVCLSVHVIVRSHISKMTYSNFTKFSVRVTLSSLRLASPLKIVQCVM